MSDSLGYFSFQIFIKKQSERQQAMYVNIFLIERKIQLAVDKVSLLPIAQLNNS